MSAVPFWHIDAFASRAFAGNQAAVLLLDTWLPDQTLQAIAEENRFAATAFVVTAADRPGEWELRWFTPTAEIALCGHASLAAAHAVFTRDEAPIAHERVVFHTRQSGTLEVVRNGNRYELALPVIETAPQAYPEAVELLGAEPIEVRRNETRHTILVFESAAVVRALAPDLRGLARLGNDQFICTARGEEADIVSRVFVPGAGVDEDSVTGSAHAALAPYWAEKLGRNSLSAYQASARGGELTLRLDGGRVWLGGACTTNVEGKFAI